MALNQGRIKKENMQAVMSLKAKLFDIKFINYGEIEKKFSVLESLFIKLDFLGTPV